MRRPRKWLSASGLLAGSIVPDFEYFLRMRKGFSYYSHTWLGLLWFDLPFAVLLTLLFHQVVRLPLLEHLPAPLLARLVGITPPAWLHVLKTRWAVVLLSILIGVMTHFGWDWFVHQSSDYLYQRQNSLGAFDGWKTPIQLYNQLHLGHSLAGLVAIALAIYYLPVSPAVSERNGSGLLFWLSVMLLTALIAGLRVALGTGLYLQDQLVAALAAFLLALTLTCCGWQLAKKR